MVANAFTCTGPYAILILLGLKRVENRNAMPVPAKGRVSADRRSLREAKSLERCAISCSKSFCREEYGEFVRWASRTLKPEEFEAIPAWEEVKDWPGKVVGCCDYEVWNAETGISSPCTDGVGAECRTLRASSLAGGCSHPKVRKSSTQGG